MHHRSVSLFAAVHLPPAPPPPTVPLRSAARIFFRLREPFPRLYPALFHRRPKKKNWKLKATTDYLPVYHKIAHPSRRVSASKAPLIPLTARKRVKAQGGAVGVSRREFVSRLRNFQARSTTPGGGKFVRPRWSKFSTGLVKRVLIYRILGNGCALLFFFYLAVAPVARDSGEFEVKAESLRLWGRSESLSFSYRLRLI